MPALDVIYITTTTRYYLLPLGILLAALSFILVFILWTIIKEFVLKKILTEKEGTRAELKMAVLISYSLMITA